MEKNGGGGAPPAATGCYRCGRPGHWGRDCTFSATETNPNPISTTSNTNNPKSNTYFSGSSSSSFKTAGGGFSKPFVDKPIEKPKKIPRVRPKLTPALLLSDNGLGYVLRHFPRSFKSRGRGHEVEDLGNLIGLYTQWHSRLLPYYSFDQFVEKVEQVGATRHVRTCVRELRERVSNGGDPSKLHEPPVHLNEPAEPTPEPDNATNLENPDAGDSVLEAHHDMDVEEEMLDEVYQMATTETSHSSPAPVTISTAPVPSGSSTAQLSDEQKARIEANRLKALERARVRELRERVANGGDPSKLREPLVHLNEHAEPTPEPENASNLENPDTGDSVLEAHHDMDVEEEMLDEVYQMATTETSHSSPAPVTISTAQVPSDHNSSLNISPNQPSDNGTNNSSTAQLSDEQKARIEANRLKALERAAARARSLQAA
ncbi:hypothetical protein MKW94_002439 [Papaver nudicaule]|uniref:CCHC-type domain-containing protein n=1 Tax=Papaver nudicaule TaxID=74823 RepID=A0AA41SLT3_PAPNU|nr:hypothetical protein [Papaver nudicaule]